MPASSSERIFDTLTRRHIEVLAALERLEPRLRRRERVASTLGISLAGVKSLLTRTTASAALLAIVGAPIAAIAVVRGNIADLLKER
jgi:hypothetical protein